MVCSGLLGCRLLLGGSGRGGDGMAPFKVGAVGTQVASWSSCSLRYMMSEIEDPTVLAVHHRVFWGTS
jgi:hypothetical protein